MHALGNKGYALFLLGQQDEVKPYLEAIELGSEELRQDELNDAGIQDEAFKELIRSFQVL